MINTAGAYLLILVYASGGGQNGGITTAEAENYDACKAMVTQVEPIRGVTGYCIAKELVKE